jgi:hypothetical protein
MRNLMRFSLRVRLLLFMSIALLVGANGAGSSGRTLAYFTAVAVDTGNVISTVSLSMTAPSSSGVFNIASNMIPGDFQLKPIDIVNGVNGVPGVQQQDFTYSLVNTNSAGGDFCSFLDSSPTCGAANPPNAGATSGAALLLMRCTGDQAGVVLASCSAANVWATQVYPSAGEGTQVQLGAGGLVNTAIAGVSSAAITVGGTSFSGGQVLIGAAYPVGGPNAVAGSDGQAKGLVAGNTDHLAAIVYLPSTAGNTLADQKSALTFTWTAQQRLGGSR